MVSTWIPIVINKLFADDWLKPGVRLEYIIYWTNLNMAAKRAGRLQLAALSEFYEDLLRADAFLANNSLGSQGKSLLQSFLSQKEPKIKERIEYLAKKRNIAYEDMWLQIQNGTAVQLRQDELDDED